MPSWLQIISCSSNGGKQHQDVVMKMAAMMMQHPSSLFQDDSPAAAIMIDTYTFYFIQGLIRGGRTMEDGFRHMK